MKQLGFICSRKTQKNPSPKLKTSKSPRQTITIYAQNVFLNNSLVQNINGDFHVEKKYSHNGDLQKTAAKTPVRNLAFEKHNDEFKIMETKNPKICDSENIGVYDLSTRNSNPEFDGKYRQHQTISEKSMVLSDENFNGENSNGDSINFEKFVGNLVLNHLGWLFENGGYIQISSGKNDTVYTTLDNSKYDLTKITLTMKNKTYKIYTPKIMMKLCELGKNSGYSSWVSNRKI